MKRRTEDSPHSSLRSRSRRQCFTVSSHILLSPVRPCVASDFSSICLFNIYYFYYIFLIIFLRSTFETKILSPRLIRWTARSQQYLLVPREGLFCYWQIGLLARRKRSRTSSNSSSRALRQTRTPAVVDGVTYSRCSQLLRSPRPPPFPPHPPPPPRTISPPLFVFQTNPLPHARSRSVSLFSLRRNSGKLPPLPSILPPPHPPPAPSSVGWPLPLSRAPLVSPPFSPPRSLVHILLDYPHQEDARRSLIVYFFRDSLVRSVRFSTDVRVFTIKRAPRCILLDDKGLLLDIFRFY